MALFCGHVCAHLNWRLKKSLLSSWCTWLCYTLWEHQCGPLRRILRDLGRLAHRRTGTPRRHTHSTREARPRRRPRSVALSRHYRRRTHESRVHDVK